MFCKFISKVIEFGGNVFEVNKDRFITDLKYYIFSRISIF